MLRSLRKVRPLVALITSCAFVAPGCADFDREDRINDLRVLAVRTEPAEIMFHPFHGLLPAEQRPPFLQLPTTPVQVEVFAFEPRHGDVTTTVSMCPEGFGVCNDFDLEGHLQNEPEPTRDEVRDAWRPREFENDLDSSDTDNPAGQLHGIGYEMSFTPAVIDSIIPDAVGQDGLRFPLVSFFPEWPRFIVDADSPVVIDEIGVTSERAYKRLPVGIDFAHPEAPPELRDVFSNILGIQFCEAPIPDADFREGPWPCLEPRDPNRNPRLLGFDIDVLDDVDETLFNEGMRYHTSPDLGRRSLLRVARGSQIALTPVFEPDDVERYQALKFDIEGQRVFLENRIEDYTATWRSTNGDISNDVTSLQFNRRLGVTWTFPVEKDPGDRDQLMLVVRDQRGGVVWATITVEYR